jgi:polygalacturonase
MLVSSRILRFLLTLMMFTLFFSIPLVAAANTAPAVVISSPANNASYLKGAAISFSGTANDAQDGALTSKIDWVSSINGALGSGGSISTAGLSDGTHTITATATDSKGLSGSAKVSIIVTATTPTTYYNVVNYGATGSDTTDDTAAIQKAINYVNSIGGGTVYIPDGTYYINTGTSVKPKNNVKLKLAANATLKAIPNAREYYDIVNFYGVSNAGIDGGYIVGDRYKHSGTTGEWGMGIRVSSSSNISISNVKISDCWGDGIIVGGGLTTKPYSQNVVIENVVSNNNRRQGISVISAKGLTIRNGTLSNTNGTKPQAGIDFEPGASTNLVQDILIENTKIINNYGWGVDWWFYHLIGSGNYVTIKINNCTVTNNGTGQIRPLTSSNSYYTYADITVNGVQKGGA